MGRCIVSLTFWDLAMPHRLSKCCWVCCREQAEYRAMGCCKAGTMALMGAEDAASLHQSAFPGPGRQAAMLSLSATSMAPQQHHHQAAAQQAARQRSQSWEACHSARRRRR